MKEKIEFLIEEFEMGYINPYKLIIQLKEIIEDENN